MPADITNMHTLTGTGFACRFGITMLARLDPDLLSMPVMWPNRSTELNPSFVTQNDKKRQGIPVGHFSSDHCASIHGHS